VLAVETLNHNKPKPKQTMKTKAYAGAGNGEITEAFAKWFIDQPIKVQENHLDCMSTNQAVELARLVLKLCPYL
jgi:hypothetical protein